jgi:Tol biopolymer transport system component
MSRIIKFFSRIFTIYFIFVVGFFLLGACVKGESISSTLSNPAISKVKTDMDLYFLQPVWHPNGDYVAIVGVNKCKGNCPSSIYGLQPSTGHVWEILHIQDINPIWTPDGLLSFWGDSQENGAGIYVSPITNYDPSFFHKGSTVSWSSSGKYASVYNIRDDNYTDIFNYNLEIIDLQSKKDTFVFPPPSTKGGAEGSMQWSTNSDQLAFVIIFHVNDISESRLYTVQPDGSNLHSYAADYGEKNSAGWIKNDQWIFFVFGEEKTLAFVNVEEDCVVTSAISGIDNLALSPDQSKFVFTHYGDVWLIDTKILLGPNFEGLTCD